MKRSKTKRKNRKKRIKKTKKKEEKSSTICQDPQIPGFSLEKFFGLRLEMGYRVVFWVENCSGFFELNHTR